MMDKRNNSGNALFMILIAIFLLGAVTAMVVRTGGTSNETGETERSRIAATEILRNAASVKAGVDNLLLRGCSESELDFHSDIMLDDMWTSYQNANRRTDNSCSLYHEAGMGLKYYILPESYYFDDADTAYRWFVTSDTNASYNVAGTPSDTSDLVWYVHNLRRDICVQINKILGIPLDPDGEPFFDNQDAWWEYYQGRFRTNANGIADEAGAGHFEQKAGCYLNPDDNYTFYQLLIAK